MKIVIISPSKAYVTGSPEELDSLHQELTYTNTSEAHALKRLYTNHWFKSRNNAGWQKAIEDAKKRVKRTLVYEDEHGTWIRPGSIPYLTLKVDIVDERCYPKPKSIAWHKPLPFELYPYQEESWEKLLEVKHGNVELCTGSGKTPTILKLCRELGLRTAIIAPSKSIFGELLNKFEHHFGKGKVGTFGNSKKKLGKQFTICISDSICNIKPGTPEWEFFSTLDCIVQDESHVLAAETLEEICYGVLENVPYRFFFSGTQTRNDGGIKLLQSIIGETVHTLSTKEAVEGGYICPHEYKIVSVESSNPNFNSQDALEMKRVHLLKNKNVCVFIAKLINSVAAYRQQVLVLVEELEQISMLTKLLNVPFVYAHSEKKADRLQELGLSKVDPDESVERFNKGEVTTLIGTSCIAVGTNIYPTHHCISWIGGSSEIKIKQGTIGRAIRLGSQNPWADRCTPKTKTVIWDFNVHDVSLMVKHLGERLPFYKESGSKIEFVNIKR